MDDSPSRPTEACHSQRRHRAPSLPRSVRYIFPLIFAGALVAHAQSPTERAIFGPEKPLLGRGSCATSGCHGGAGEKSNQVVIWEQRDMHSRSFATLTTARAARMAEALSIPDPATSARCTACHAPLQTIPPELLAAGERINEGVSCGSCHGPATDWLRSHTRPDYTHAERVAAGLRELRDLPSRATACIACHQNIEPALVNVGRHPVLIFELDGQTQSEPRHWREPAGRDGAQAWFVGQTVALREVAWALHEQRADPTRDAATLQALVWLVQRASPHSEATLGAPLSADASAPTLAATVAAADELARRAAHEWSAGEGERMLAKLAATAPEFTAAAPALPQAVRAERLVLALDRLLAARPPAQRRPALSAQLDRLYRLAQSQPGFAPAAFSRELTTFAALLK